jgi:hypothetical protein
MIPLSNTSRLLLGLACLNVVLHLAFHNTLGYHRDELLYFTLGQHPAFGYASVPPLIGWIATLVSTMLGYSLFAVRLVPALLSGVMVILTAQIARELGGKHYAQVLAASSLICTPFSLRTFYLFQPVFLDISFWTLLLYLTLRYINTQDRKYLIGMGAASGVAMLNKYLVGLLILILLLMLLLSRHRTAFLKKEMYWGLFLALAIFFPNLLWQLSNGLPVINHIQELNETQLVNVSYGNFLAEQLLIPLAASLLTVPGLIFLLVHPRAKQYRMLGWVAMLVVLSLLLLRGKSYYTIGIFPTLIAAGAVFYEVIIAQSRLRWALPVIIVLITLPVLPIGIPIYGPEGLVDYFDTLEKEYGIDVGRRFEDGTIHSLPQDYADMLGWQSIATLTAQAHHQVPKSEKAVIYCENYGQAGAICVIGQQFGLPEPVSFSDSFRYWLPDSIPDDVNYFIYVNDELGKDVESAFSKVKIIGAVSNPHAREYGTTVYLCSHPRESLNTLWQQAVDRVRNQ